MRSFWIVALAFGVVGVATAQAPEPGHRCAANCDTPSTSSPSSNSSGPVTLDPAQQQELQRLQQQQQMQQQMMDTAGQLGFALGTALGKALSGQGDVEKAQDLNNQAIAAAQRGDWQRARALTLQALQLVPDDPQLKQNLAFVDRQIAQQEQEQATREQQAEAARQEAARQAELRRKEEMAAHLSGQLKTTGTAQARSGNAIQFKGLQHPVAVASSRETLVGGMPLKSGGESGTGTPFFGSGGNGGAGAASQANGESSPHVIDSRDAAGGQYIGGAGTQQGPADKAPAGSAAYSNAPSIGGMRLKTAGPAQAPAVSAAAPATVVASAASPQAVRATKSPHASNGNDARSLDCIMQGLYGQAGALGPASQSFIADLKRQERSATRSLSRAPATGNGDYDVFTGTLDSMKQAGKSDAQMVVNTQITRDAGTGETRIHVLSQLNKADSQSLVVLDRNGAVMCQQVPAPVAACMRAFNPASTPDYCPREPGASK